MSLQRIIDTCQSLSMDRRKVSGQQRTRSGLTKISSIATRVPWTWTVTPQPGFNINTDRGILENLDLVDRAITQTVDVGLSNQKLSYLTRYQGQLGTAQRAELVFQSANILEITISLPTGLPDGTVVFRNGDFISLDTDYKYPYTVVGDALTTSANQSTITLNINRPFIQQSDYNPVGKTLRTGSEVTWNMVITTRPSYTIESGGWISWSGNFELTEVIED